MINVNERKSGELFGNLWTSLSDDQYPQEDNQSIL
jgi:hypothetical protein